MSLTQQFLIISLLPLSFIGMAVYSWRAAIPRPSVRLRWTLTLIITALWSSNMLRFYGGVSFSKALVFSWGIVGNYLFGLMALLILLTTLSHLTTAASQGRVGLILSAFLWLASLGLDPALWPYQITTLPLANQTIRHFDLWAAVWIASWLLPIVAAWIATQQAISSSPTSLYRNQIRYWLLLLTLLLGAGGLASIRQPGQPAWQEASVILLIFAGLIGTTSITRNQLTPLPLVARRILSRLSGTLILFGLTWAALRLIVQVVTNLPVDTSPNLIITMAAALFAGFFILVYRLVNALTRRLFVPASARQKSAANQYATAIANLPEPIQLSQLILRIIQSNLAVDDAWLFIAEGSPEGKLVLQPLASLDDQLPPALEFAAESPFAALLRRQSTPIVHYDIELLADFDEMPTLEKTALANLQRELYLPLHAGDRLLGLIALAAKASGEAYERSDFAELEALAFRMSPLLAQAQQLARLRLINDYLFQQNQALTHRGQHLSQLSQLYTRFIALISPQLRRPFPAINQQLRQIQSHFDPEDRDAQLFAGLMQQLEQVKSPIDRLIHLSNHIQQPDHFDLEAVRLEDITAQVVHNLHRMAEARRVTVRFDVPTNLPPLLGEAEKLREAVQHLLHNAIKFNKIGGQVDLHFTVSDSHLSLHVKDTGVGIPSEQLDMIGTSLGNIYDQRTEDMRLGLALTQFIVAAHGGHVTAESSYGNGSTFSIHLPLLIENEAPANNGSG